MNQPPLYELEHGARKWRIGDLYGNRRRTDRTREWYLDGLMPHSQGPAPE